MGSIMTLIGRILLALVFIISGVSKIGGYAGTLAYMQSKGVPMPQVMLIAAILIEIGCGLSVATGFRARVGALVLALFLVPVTYLFHFKAAFDPAMNMVDRMQMVQVLKNLAIMGGLLMIWGNGAGNLTIGRDKA